MAVKTLLTADDLLQMSSLGRAELIRGELVKMTPSGGEHGISRVTIGSLLLNFVKPRKLGRVFGAETGIIISRDPTRCALPMRRTCRMSAWRRWRI